MKLSYFTLLSFISFSLSLTSQNAPIDFEAGGFGADWTWAVFENDTNPPLEIIPNPDPSGANTSATVAQFTALATGNPWAGTESSLATDLGVYTLSEENSIVKIMVWKTNISNVGIKMVTTSLGALPELLVPNTVTNQWEEITFDFSGYIDNAIYAIEDVAQIVIFPDFMARNEDHVSYFDNITIGGAEVGLIEYTESAFTVYPNPTEDMLTISGAEQIDAVVLRDVLGAVVLQLNTPFSNQVTLDIADLTSGVYFVEVRVGDVVNVSHVIKK